MTAMDCPAAHRKWEGEERRRGPEKENSAKRGGKRDEIHLEGGRDRDLQELGDNARIEGKRKGVKGGERGIDAGLQGRETCRCPLKRVHSPRKKRVVGKVTKEIREGKSENGGWTLLPSFLEVNGDKKTKKGTGRR